jgi:ubiquinone/menaquinone biosynthesis C-methylase UbiE
MDAQIGLLELRTGELLVDLGAGTGDCPLVIAARPESPGNLTIVEIDFVNDALARGRRRMQDLGSNERAPTLLHVCADLGRSDAARIPLLAGVADAVIASLLISYLPNVEDLLSEAIELLRPGGRLVLSSLRRDADISRIYVDGISELPPDRVREHFGETAVEDFDRLQRQFLNDAARLIDFEEAGHFRFWDADELERAVTKAGFVDVCSKAVFGEPPQAVVVGARRP